MANTYSQPKYDIQGQQLENRVVHLDGQINDELATYIRQVLLHLNDLDSSKPIQMFVNSPGGSVTAGNIIVNTMKYISAPVYTCGNGLCASMGAVILSAGEPGHRYSFEDTSIMLHQVSSGAEGNIQDIRVSFEQTEKLNKRLMKKLAKNCGKTLEQLEKDTVRDLWMFPEDAVKYGIIDKVIVEESDISK
jgi:ATP-dependent Clp protease, protease subunit